MNAIISCGAAICDGVCEVQCHRSPCGAVDINSIGNVTRRYNDNTRHVFQTFNSKRRFCARTSTAGADDCRLLIAVWDIVG